MKKTLLFAFALTMGIASVSAQGDFSVKREWKTNTTAAGIDARQGCYANGKFYIQNKALGEIEIWDQTGKLGTLPSTKKGTSIAADAAGNILVTNVTEFDFGKESGTKRPVRIYPNGQAPAKDVDLFLACPPPAALTSDMRSDYFGEIDGNIMSAEGGELCMVVNRRKYLNVLPIKNGVQDDDNTQAIVITDCFVNPTPAFQENGSGISTLSQVISYKFDGQYCFENKFIGLKGIEATADDLGNLTGKNVDDYTTGQSVWAVNPAYECWMVGSKLFKLGNEKYVLAIIQYKGEGPKDSSFAIVRASDGEKVAIWHAKDVQEDKILATSAGAMWFKIVPVDETKAEIFQYFPAEAAGTGWIAKYIFTAGAGVEGVEADQKATVIAGQGMITVEGEAENVEVYTMAGALVSKGETTIECAAGLYIVNVDGHATKVLVK